MRAILSGFCVLLLAAVAHAQGQLEVPGSGSFQSGIGIVSGWKCTAGAVTVQFDNGPTYTAAYGTIREDTQGVCGDTNNGWALLWNWNRLGDGPHTVKVFDNGVQFGFTTITVQTLGAEFQTGLNKSVTVNDFPAPGQSVTLQWQQGQQNFVIAGMAGGGGGSNADLEALLGTWRFDYSVGTAGFSQIYRLLQVVTTPTATGIGGLDEFNDVIAVIRTRDVLDDSFPYDFFLLDESIIICRAFFFNQTSANTLIGRYIQLSVVTGECESSLTGLDYPMTGTRLGNASSEALPVRDQRTQDLAEVQGALNDPTSKTLSIDPEALKKLIQHAQQ